jgi:hypothetical protein
MIHRLILITVKQATNTDRNTKTNIYKTTNYHGNTSKYDKNINKTDKQADTLKTNKQTDRQTDTLETNKQTDRQTDRQTH